MLKKIKYLFEASLIYLIFLLIKCLGLKISRVFFSFIFRKIGPLIKSSKITKKNLLRFSNQMSNKELNLIMSEMWSITEKHLLNICF